MGRATVGYPYNAERSVERCDHSQIRKDLEGSARGSLKRLSESTTFAIHASQYYGGDLNREPPE
jgi:hypothetical protein